MWKKNVLIVFSILVLSIFFATSCRFIMTDYESDEDKSDDEKSSFNHQIKIEQLL